MKKKLKNTEEEHKPKGKENKEKKIMVKLFFPKNVKSCLILKTKKKKE